MWLVFIFHWSDHATRILIGIAHCSIPSPEVKDQRLAPVTSTIPCRTCPRRPNSRSMGSSGRLSGVYLSSGSNIGFVVRGFIFNDELVLNNRWTDFFFSLRSSEFHITKGQVIFCQSWLQKPFNVHVKLTFKSSADPLAKIAPLRMDFSVLWLQGSRWVENPKVHRGSPAVHRNGHIATRR